MRVESEVLKVESQDRRLETGDGGVERDPSVLSPEPSVPIRRSSDFGELPSGLSLRVEDSRAVTESLVEIQISDTGLGIPPEILPRIFDPFFSTKEQGSGLGL
ncbi:MAG: ATP-binding protein, partial [candidate division NC10 bacterium]